MRSFRAYDYAPWLELLSGMNGKQHVAVFEGKIPPGLNYKRLTPECYADLAADEDMAKYLVCLGVVEDFRMSELTYLADFKPRVHSAVMDTIIILAEKT